MNLRRLFCVSSLLLVTSMGCCHSRCVCSDPCDPCGGAGARRGCCLTNWMHNKVGSWRLRNHGRNYGWNDIGCDCMECGSACDSCGMTYDGGAMMGAPSPSGCSCGQHHSEFVPSTPTYAPNAPAATPPTSVNPSAPANTPTPPAGNDPPPVPASSTDSTAVPRTLSNQVQHVSVEEFHRLPGVITSGPTPQSSVPTVATSPTATQPQLSIPPLSTVSTPPRALTGAQQASWTPVKQ